MLERPNGGQRAVLVGLDSAAARRRARSTSSPRSRRSAGATVVGRVTGKRAAPDPALYAGKGKVDEIARRARRGAAPTS